jgi:hypothetical protein
LIRFDPIVGQYGVGGASIDKEQQAAPERLNELALAAVRGHHRMIEETTDVEEGCVVSERSCRDYEYISEHSNHWRGSRIDRAADLRLETAGGVTSWVWNEWNA